MKMLVDLVANSSTQVRLALVTADLIPQLIVTLNPLSLSFTEGVDIHTGLIRIITWSVWLSLPYHLTKLGIEDDNGQQAVHETVLQQVLAPSEQYISYLCVNRYSIVGGDQSRYFLLILAQLLRSSMMDILRKVDKQGGEVRQMWKIVSRMLRMEGIEDVMEEKLRNHRDQTFGGAIVTFSIKWNNMLGMNLTRRA
ncbi:hypothetical protein BLNAU_8456 [Blattamonas nauphoetae]|uniref:Uncharacterized protein n=1 Tax=Blattamonas nauphoetae TaxID=2049346 RepID=A0ABQ9XYT0_9EUKA|nr:hypothetical protein BLNAU_8456 [Blattamonas nauphoetae]